MRAVLSSSDYSVRLRWPTTPSGKQSRKLATLRRTKQYPHPQTHFMNVVYPNRWLPGMVFFAALRAYATIRNDSIFRLAFRINSHYSSVTSPRFQRSRVDFAWPTKRNPV
jgi:hypothetical protein